ncbi:GNAT family N-acetyltransferase [Demequina gelatinilytica]|uniref:GNAT family N-acetyltransferase n=1 Tax=Demequina gelatinilytica TaxID=1638980 RepID=UPI000781752E|nr:GNAT family N-acetyltransferase [Demequina gelatinilytica]
MTLSYRTDAPVTAAQYLDALDRSTLGERRPTDDPAVFERALAASNLLVTAWDGALLVGFARALTDFELMCYLQDLGVDAAYQRRGIGLELQRLMRAQLGPHCKVRLSAAPDAAGYYPALGYRRHDRSWELLPGDPLG